MKQPNVNTLGSHVSETIEGRSPAGRHDPVQSWHKLLIKILGQIDAYIREGHLVTFRRKNEREGEIFKKISQTISVPDTVVAIYMPPSVRFQMMYYRPEGVIQPIPDHSPDNPPDDGIVLACRKSDFNFIINALLAKPPFAPTVDVFDD